MDFRDQRLLLALLAGGGSRKRAAPSRPAATVCGVVILALSASACGSGSEPSNRFATDANLQTQVDKVVSRLRVEAVGAGAVDTEALHAHVADECVRRHGIAVPEQPRLPVDPGVVPEVTDLDLWLNRGQPLGRATALSDPAKLQKQRNFHKQTASIENPPYPAEAMKFLEGDPPQLLEMPLPGGHGGSLVVPVGGCHGQATEDIYGVPAEKFERTRLALPRLDTVMDETISDDRVDDRIGAYESCMKELGLEARTPADLQESMAAVVSGVLKGSEQPSRLVEIEQRVVAADAKCKDNSGLGTAFAETFVEKGNAALTKTEGVIVEYRRMMEHARSVARQIESMR